MEYTSNTNITALNFLDLVQKGQKSFQNENDFNAFLSLDLNIKGVSGWTPIMQITLNNTTFNYLLNPKQIMQICEKSDIKSLNEDGQNYLHYIFLFNKSEKLNLNNQAISFLFKKIKKNNLNYKDDSGWTYFEYILDNNETENLGFTNQQLCAIYDETVKSFNNKKQEFIDNIKINYPHFSILYEKTKLSDVKAPKKQTSNKPRL